MLMYLKDITLVKNNKRWFIVAGFFEQFCAHLLLWNWGLERSNDLISFNRRYVLAERRRHVISPSAPSTLVWTDSAWTHWSQQDCCHWTNHTRTGLLTFIWTRALYSCLHPFNASPPGWQQMMTTWTSWQLQVTLLYSSSVRKWIVMVPDGGLLWAASICHNNLTECEWRFGTQFIKSSSTQSVVYIYCCAHLF